MEREKPHYISLGNSYATIISGVEFHTSLFNQLTLNVWISIIIFLLFKVGPWCDDKDNVCEF